MQTKEKVQVKTNPRDFILGGRAEFTLEGEDGYQYKYIVRRNANGTMFFVNTKSSKTSKYEYQGYIRQMGKIYIFSVGNKGNALYDPEEIGLLLSAVNTASGSYSTVKVYHHGTCSACGRRLTDIKSIECGLGPKCRERLGY